MFKIVNEEFSSLDDKNVVLRHNLKYIQSEVESLKYTFWIEFLSKNAYMEGLKSTQHWERFLETGYVALTEIFCNVFTDFNKHFGGFQVETRNSSN